MPGRTRERTRRRPRGTPPRPPVDHDAETTPQRSMRAMPASPRPRSGGGCRPPRPERRVRGGRGGHRRAHHDLRRRACREPCNALDRRALPWSPVELRILGPLEVLDDDGAPVDVGGSRPRTLLVDLALAQGHPVPADQLLEDVWSGERIPARNNLQVHVSRLRRALGEERIATRGGGYALELPRDALDAARFDRLSAQGRAALHAGDAEAAATALRDALALWRGAALVDFADDAFARPVITRLEESRFTAIEDRIEADLLLGRHAELIGELEALVQEHPLRERLWAQLMTALYRAGRQADALRAYQRARTILAEQLGIDPGPELRQLERRCSPRIPRWRRRPCRPRSTLRTSPRRICPERRPSSSAGRRDRRDDNAPPRAPGRDDRRSRRRRQDVPRGRGGPAPAGRVRGRRVHRRPRAGRAMRSGFRRDLPTRLGVEAEFGEGASSNLRERCVSISADACVREFLRAATRCWSSTTASTSSRSPRRSSRISSVVRASCASSTTSREPLMIGGEVLWPLAPLEARRCRRALLERARASRRRSRRAERERGTVRTICERLDCLPLAIELAAARMRAFTPDDLVGRLDDRFRLLTGGARTAFPRQQTLRAVVDWSYDLLFDDERRVFERVSVFAGTFGVAAAEDGLCRRRHHRDDVAELLARLVDKSLVTASDDRARCRVPAAADARPVRPRTARAIGRRGRDPRPPRLVRRERGRGPGRGARGGRGRLVRRRRRTARRHPPRDGMGGRVGRRRRRVRDRGWARLVLEHGRPHRRHVAMAHGGALARRADAAEPADPRARLGRARRHGARQRAGDRVRRRGVARARALGDDSPLALATMLHGSALSDFFHRTEAATELVEESRPRSRRSATTGVGPWRPGRRRDLLGARRLRRRAS